MKVAMVQRVLGVTAVALAFLVASSDADARSGLSFSQCLSSMEQSNTVDDAVNASSACIADTTARYFLESSADHLSLYGKAVFGRGFHIQHSLDYSVLGDGRIRGDLDAVIPLHASYSGQSQNFATLPDTALFLQNGISSWTDAQGINRTDTRVGLVQRLSLGGQHLVGLSAMLQENLEFGHRRQVLGVDYAGVWGQAYANHYGVISDWLVSRIGYEARAIGGHEVGVAFTPTSAIKVDFSVGSWDSRTQIGSRVVESRVSLGWQPHPYVQFSSNWQGGNESEARSDVRLNVRVPLGGNLPRARWVGLGVRPEASLQERDAWRTVQSRSRVEVVERELILSADDATPEDLSVRFLQDKAQSGSKVAIEVSANGVLSGELLVRVQLLPSGDNPAISGEDFLPEPVEIRIQKGERVGVVEIQLLQNPALKSARNVRAEIVAVGGVSS